MIIVKDALGTSRQIKTTLSGDDHIPHHIVDSSALPSGAATAANQSTALTYLATLAGAVGGTEFQMDLASSLPPGTNMIGKVVIDPGLTIKHGVITGTSATVAISGVSLVPKRGEIMVSSRATNSGPIYFGDATTAHENGFELTPGQRFTLPVYDLADLYAFIATGDKLFWYALT